MSDHIESLEAALARGLGELRRSLWIPANVPMTVSITGRDEDAHV